MLNSLLTATQRSVSIEKTEADNGKDRKWGKKNTMFRKTCGMRKACSPSSPFWKWPLRLPSVWSSSSSLTWHTTICWLCRECSWSLNIQSEDASRNVNSSACSIWRDPLIWHIRKSLLNPCLEHVPLKAFRKAPFSKPEHISVTSSGYSGQHEPGCPQGLSKQRLTPGCGPHRTVPRWMTEGSALTNWCWKPSPPPHTSSRGNGSNPDPSSSSETGVYSAKTIHFPYSDICVWKGLTPPFGNWAFYLLCIKKAAAPHFHVIRAEQ